MLYIYIFSFGFFSIIGHYKIFNIVPCAYIGGFPGGSEVKVSACNAGDLGSIPGLGRSPEEGNGNPLQYSCLENPMVRGAWWATVHGVAKSQTGLSDFTFTFTFVLIYLYTVMCILCLFPSYNSDVLTPGGLLTLER